MLNFPDLGAQSSKSHSPLLLFPRRGRLSPTPFGAHIFSWWGGGGTRGLNCSVLCDGHVPNSPSLGWHPPSPPLELIRPKTSKLSILAWTCASSHNGVHFFDISISKSGPSMRCFARFDLEMCCAPQRRAIFHFSPPQMAPHLPL